MLRKSPSESHPRTIPLRVSPAGLTLRSYIFPMHTYILRVNAPHETLRALRGVDAELLIEINA